MEEDDEGRDVLIGLLSGHVGWGERGHWRLQVQQGTAPASDDAQSIFLVQRPTCLHQPAHIDLLGQARQQSGL